MVSGFEINICCKRCCTSPRFPRSGLLPPRGSCLLLLGILLSLALFDAFVVFDCCWLVWLVKPVVVALGLSPEGLFLITKCIVCPSLIPIGRALCLENLIRVKIGMCISVYSCIITRLLRLNGKRSYSPVLTMCLYVLYIFKDLTTKYEDSQCRITYLE